MGDARQETPTLAQLWEQDRALLEEHGACHIETICAVARALRDDGQEDEAAELDRQCARMRILAMSDADLLALYEHTDGEPGHELADLMAEEIKRRDLDL